MDTERLALLIRGICALQEEKERAYGVDWKRFGLVSAMFNVFRKFIRLRTIWQAGWNPTPDDSRLDTLVDLLNYLVLCMLLHAEITPAAFRSLFSRASFTPDPSLYTTDEKGFKEFCHTILFPGARDARIDEERLAALIPSLLEIGERTVEAWLFQVSEVAEGRLAPSIDPTVRLANIRTMSLVCIAVIMRHAQEAPEEWDHFMQRYGGNTYTL